MEMDYLTMRKEIYMREYIRLIRNTSQYHILLEKIRSGVNIIVCEMDVSSKKKRGIYGED